MPDENPTPENTPATPPEKTPTAAETAAAGKSKREIALEKKVSEQEDAIQGLRGELKAVTDYVSEAKKVPSARKPGKTLIDELNDFVFGEVETPNPAAPATPGKV